MQKRLYRSDDRFLGGVCAGIAEYFDLDPTLVRIAYVVLSAFGFFITGLIIYFILWFVIPPRTPI
jgi:phage shock protein PspC (stress-responsive transcriptional regulator)